MLATPLARWQALRNSLHNHAPRVIGWHRSQSLLEILRSSTEDSLRPPAWLVRVGVCSWGVEQHCHVSPLHRGAKALQLCKQQAAAARSVGCVARDGTSTLAFVQVRARQQQTALGLMRERQAKPRSAALGARHEVDPRKKGNFNVCRAKKITSIGTADLDSLLVMCTCLCIFIIVQDNSLLHLLSSGTQGACMGSATLCNLVSRLRVATCYMWHVHHSLVQQTATQALCQLISVHAFQ